jgi:hypothetical protein
MGLGRRRALSRRGPTIVAAGDRQLSANQERTISRSGLSALTTSGPVANCFSRGSLQQQGGLAPPQERLLIKSDAQFDFGRVLLNAAKLTEIGCHSPAADPGMRGVNQGSRLLGATLLAVGGGAAGAGVGLGTWSASNWWPRHRRLSTVGIGTGVAETAGLANSGFANGNNSYGSAGLNPANVGTAFAAL